MTSRGPAKSPWIPGTTYRPRYSEAKSQQEASRRTQDSTPVDAPLKSSMSYRSRTLRLPTVKTKESNWQAYQASLPRESTGKATSTVRNPTRKKRDALLSYRETPSLLLDRRKSVSSGSRSGSGTAASSGSSSEETVPSWIPTDLVALESYDVVILPLMLKLGSAHTQAETNAAFFSLRVKIEDLWELLKLPHAVRANIRVHHFAASEGNARFLLHHLVKLLYYKNCVETCVAAIVDRELLVERIESLLVTSPETVTDSLFILLYKLHWTSKRVIRSMGDCRQCFPQPFPGFRYRGINYAQKMKVDVVVVSRNPMAWIRRGNVEGHSRSNSSTRLAGEPSVHHSLSVVQSVPAVPSAPHESEGGAEIRKSGFSRPPPVAIPEPPSAMKSASNSSPKLVKTVSISALAPRISDTVRWLSNDSHWTTSKDSESSPSEKADHDPKLPETFDHPQVLLRQSSRQSMPDYPDSPMDSESGLESDTSYASLIPEHRFAPEIRRQLVRAMRQWDGQGPAPLHRFSSFSHSVVHSQYGTAHEAVPGISMGDTDTTDEDDNAQAQAWLNHNLNLSHSHESDTSLSIAVEDS